MDKLPEHDREKPDRLISKAEECKRADPQRYREVLVDNFGSTVRTRTAFGLLMKLPFKGYVTTNFDPLLSDAGALHNREIYTYPALNVVNLVKDESPLFYIHGHVDTGDPPGSHLVLSESEFAEAYSDGARSFLSQLFQKFPVVFFGTSLQEPAVDEVFRRVNAVHRHVQQIAPGAELPPRYVILPAKYVRGDDDQPERDKESEASEDRRLAEIGVEVVRYEALTRDHEEVESILVQLCELLDEGFNRRPRVDLWEGL